MFFSPLKWFFLGWEQGIQFVWQFSCSLQNMRIPFPRGRRWSCTIKQSRRSGRHMQMAMGWWNASLSTQTQTVRGWMSTVPTLSKQPGACWWKRGGGPLSASLSCDFSFSFHLCGELFTLSSNSSSCLVCQAPELSSIARGFHNSLNRFNTPVKLFSVTGQLLGFSVFREMESWFELVQ